MVLLNVRKGRRFFEGEPSPEPAPTPEPVPNPNPNPNLNPNPNPSPTKTFTQAEVDRILATRVAEATRKVNEQNRKTITQLENLQRNQQLTEAQRAELQANIEELQNTFRTETEIKKSELEKLEKKYTTDITKERETAKQWQNRFENRLMAVDITNAAVEHDAVSPEQIEAILRPLTRVTEDLDETGKPTGNYVSKVKFQDTSPEGQPIVLDLTPSAAVKLMKERPQRYGNLFKAPSNGGTGQQPVNFPYNTGQIDLERLSPQEYKKNREAIRQQYRKATR